MDIETIFKDIMENLDQYSLETQIFIKQKYLPLLNRCNQVEHFLRTNCKKAKDFRPWMNCT